MELRTRMNGGNSSVQEVADAWKKENHEFGWSTSKMDTWAVKFTKELKEAFRKKGPVKPDPRNIHED